jgi:hypothetical protein
VEKSVSLISTSELPAWLLGFAVQVGFGEGEENTSYYQMFFSSKESRPHGDALCSRCTMQFIQFLADYEKGSFFRGIFLYY